MKSRPSNTAPDNTLNCATGAAALSIQPLTSPLPSPPTTSPAEPHTSPAHPPPQAHQLPKTTQRYQRCLKSKPYATGCETLTTGHSKGPCTRQPLPQCLGPMVQWQMPACPSYHGSKMQEKLFPAFLLESIVLLLNSTQRKCYNTNHRGQGRSLLQARCSPAAHRCCGEPTDSGVAVPGSRAQCCSECWYQRVSG